MFVVDKRILFTGNQWLLSLDRDCREGQIFFLCYSTFENELGNDHGRFSKQLILHKGSHYCEININTHSYEFCVCKITKARDGGNRREHISSKKK